MWPVIKKPKQVNGYITIDGFIVYFTQLESNADCVFTFVAIHHDNGQSSTLKLIPFCWLKSFLGPKHMKNCYSNQFQALKQLLHVPFNKHPQNDCRCKFWMWIEQPANIDEKKKLCSRLKMPNSSIRNKLFAIPKHFRYAPQIFYWRIVFACCFFYFHVQGYLHLNISSPLNFHMNLSKKFCCRQCGLIRVILILHYVFLSLSLSPFVSKKDTTKKKTTRKKSVIKLLFSFSTIYLFIIKKPIKNK